MTTNGAGTPAGSEGAAVDEAKRSREDGTGLRRPNGFTVNEPLAGRWAIAAVTFAVFLYLIRWGQSTVRSVGFLLNPAPRSTTTGLESIQQLVENISLIALALVALHVLAAATNTPRWRAGLASRREGLALRALEFLVVFLVAGGIIWCGFRAAALLEMVDPWALPEIDTSPVPSSIPTAVLEVVNSGLGGAVEELVVLAVLVVALRSARAPWWTVYVVAVALRVVFHIHYGVGYALGLGIWALGVAVLFRMTGRLWPIFAAHFVHNVIVTGTKTLGAFRPEGEDYWLSVRVDALNLLGLAGMLVGAAVFFLHCVKNDASKSPSSGDGSPPTGRA